MTAVYDIQLIGNLLTIGIFIYAAMTHSMVYYRLRNHIAHGSFALACILISMYSATNIAALYFVTDVSMYLITSKLSSAFVILAITSVAWFASEFLQDKNNIPVRPIIFLLLPFFLLNVVMSNGILWSSIDGIALSPRSLGADVMQPINPVISWPMYGLWVAISGIYLLMLRAAFLAFRNKSRRRGALLFGGLILFTAGYVFDVLIDLGFNHSYFYVSEYAALVFVIMMSLHLSDELRLNALNLEAMVADRTSALQEANKELESFSYSVSHDLRAPLRAIDGFSTVMREEQSAKLDADGKNLLNRIINNVQRMQSMIDAMLQLSNITRKEIKKSEIDISLLAQDIVHELQEQDLNRNVIVNIEENLLGHGDPLLVRIVFDNLLGNAWKYTSHAETPTITLKKHIDEHSKECFVVTDNGAGFDAQQADKLFAPFQRLHSANEFPGIGIGLATVARIIKKHGGKIWAEGKKDEGASFYVSLG